MYLLLLQRWLVVHKKYFNSWVSWTTMHVKRNEEVKQVISKHITIKTNECCNKTNWTLKIALNENFLLHQRQTRRSPNSHIIRYQIAASFFYYIWLLSVKIVWIRHFISNRTSYRQILELMSNQIASYSRNVRNLNVDITDNKIFFNMVIIYGLWTHYTFFIK